MTKELPMNKIDAHQHFWKFDPIRDSWIAEEMETIRRDFLPQDLEPLLKENGFEGCVVVQSDQSEEENDFQLNNAEKFPFIKGVVGWVDFQADNIEERLSHYSTFPKMKGFRHVLQGERDRAFMLRPAFKRGISKLKGFNFTYDILIFQDQLAFAREFVSTFPDHPFVLDHLAKPDIRSGAIQDWEKDIKALAEHENVSCKISGMVTEADWKNWKVDDFTAYMDAVVAAFGTKRIMFGSDWPVCQVAATYKQVTDLVRQYFSSFSPDEQARFFGGNASTFYSLAE